VASASRIPQIARDPRPAAREDLSGVAEVSIEGSFDEGPGRDRAPNPRAKELRFFNVDNSNLRRAKRFAKSSSRLAP
jgi:hypothetical protein